MRRLRRVEAIAALCRQCRHQLVIDGIDGNHRVFRRTGCGVVEGLGGGDLGCRIGDVGRLVDDRDDIARPDAERRGARRIAGADIRL